MAILMTLRGPQSGRHFPLHSHSTTLGRQTDCSIILEGKQVSRQHARVRFEEGQHFIEDLGSSNGTYLNGRRLTPHAPAAFTDQDNVQIGPYVFALRDSPGGAGEADPPMVVREAVNAHTI